MRLLNVGGNSKDIPLHPHFGYEWEHHTLDIDPAVSPDICCDAVKLFEMNEVYGKYDAIYCSHNLEHYYEHEVPKVLAGFKHALHRTGFCYIVVPHLMNVMRRIVAFDMDIDDTMYSVSAGDITAHDIMFGWGKQIAASGQPFFAHKCGFSPKKLERVLSHAGFFPTIVARDLDIFCVCFSTPPHKDRMAEVVGGILGC